MRTIDYSRIPPHMQAGAKRYLEHGIRPGSFLTYLFENNFLAAAGHADDENRKYFWAWAVFLYNEAPAGSHGSPEIVAAWCKAGGMSE